MHIIVLVLLALLLGFLHNLITPQLQKIVPANLQSGKILGSLFTGAFILVAFFLATFVLSIFGMRRKEV